MIDNTNQLIDPEKKERPAKFILFALVISNNVSPKPKGIIINPIQANHSISLVR